MLDLLIILGFSLIPLLVAYVLYVVLFYIFKKVWRNVGWASALIQGLQKPALLLFLELAAFLSIQIAPLSDHGEKIGNHTLLILVLLTLGWAVGSTATAIYHYIQDKHQTEALEDFSRRSFLTRSQILYRAVMFLILVLTFAAIVMTFPSIRNFGIGILGSAGVAGLAIGLAARPILTNLIAGFQIAFTRTLKIGDAVMVENEFGTIENIFLTHVIVKTWDLRRLFVPLANFIDKTYVNYSSHTTELLGVAFIFCDYRAPIEVIRSKFLTILESTHLWTKVTAKADVVDLTEHMMKVRFIMSAANPSDAFALQCHVREKMIHYLQENHPAALPHLRNLNYQEGKT
jgi:small-conductance mechanosensitive channel